MITNIDDILLKLHIDKNGSYDNQFYVIRLDNSDEYAKMYSKLEKYAINTEEPNFGINSSKNTVKITNYFEFDLANVTYNIFLIADFDTDQYYVKIGEK